MKEEQRFWANVDKSDSCWNWTASLSKSGYGAFSNNGKYVRAHRYSWSLHNGKIPDGLCVLHRCDNRKCVNPDHLWLGTHDDNMRDRTLKGRQCRGENHGRAKLTEVAARAILVSEEPYRILSARYGVIADHIYKIRAGLRWAHIH